MELEIGTDDDLFFDERNRTLKEQKSWRPKQCELIVDCLFSEVPSGQTNPDISPTEHAQILSYQADALYSKKQFAAALGVYRKGEALVPQRFVLLRRIFIEGAARCCIYLREHSQALQLARMLMEESLTLEHRMTANSLLASVHAAAGNQQEAIKCLHICIQWQPSNAHFWLKLAEAYSALYHLSQQKVQRNQTAHAKSCLTSRSDDDANPTSHTDGSGDSGGVITTENRTLVDQCAQNGDAVHVGPAVFGKTKVSVSNCQDQPRDYSKYNNHAVQRTERSSCDECFSTEQDLHIQVVPSEQTDECEFGGTCSAEDKKSAKCEHSSIRDLLNELDRLTLHDGDTKPTCADKAKAHLMCRDRQPVLFAASCLLRTRLLLKSVEHSVSSFAKVKNSQLQHQIEQSLADLHLDTAVVQVLHHHVRRIFRRGFQRLDEDATPGADNELGARGDKEEGGSLPTEEFEQRWFPWVLGGS